MQQSTHVPSKRSQRSFFIALIFSANSAESTRVGGKGKWEHERHEGHERCENAKGKGLEACYTAPELVKAKAGQGYGR